MHTAKKYGVTIVELTVVILILSILASISISVYTGYLRRARFAVTRNTIREIELNLVRYEVDLGEFPPSSSGTTFGPSAPNATPPVVGCGYMTLCLLHSYSGSAYHPASERWFGSYMSVPLEKQGHYLGDPLLQSTSPASISMLDPWKNPYYYVRSGADYIYFGATQQLDTPFRAIGETYYNPSTFQIYSLGPDGQSSNATGRAGLGSDDVNNFYTGGQAVSSSSAPPAASPSIGLENAQPLLASAAPGASRATLARDAEPAQGRQMRKAVEELRERRLEGSSFDKVVLDTHYQKVRVGRDIVEQPVVVATGTKDRTGKREVLGYWLDDPKIKSTWSKVFSELRERGLADVARIVCDQTARGEQERFFASSKWNSQEGEPMATTSKERVYASARQCEDAMGMQLVEQQTDWYQH